MLPVKIVFPALSQPRDLQNIALYLGTEKKICYWMAESLSDRNH